MVIPKGRGTQPRSFFLRECVYVSMANNSNYSILSGSAGKGETSLSIDIPYPVENNNFIVWLILPTGQVVQGSGSYNNGRISITNKIDTSDEWGAIVYRAETAVLNATLKSSGEVSLSDIIAQFSKNVRVLEQLETLVKTSVRAVDEIGPLPNVAKRAGKFISFDDNGNPVANIAVTTLEENRTKAETAQAKAETAQAEAETAQEKARAWAIGNKDYTETINNNAKYYADSASEVVNGFDGKVDEATTNFNDNYKEKKDAIDKIASDVNTKVNGFDSKVDEATSNLTQHKYILDDAIDEHFHSVESDFAENVSSEIGKYNDNATSKTTTFNNNASSKLTQFNNNASGVLSQVKGYASEAKNARDEAVEIVDPEGWRTDTRANISSLAVAKANRGEFWFNGGTSNLRVSTLSYNQGDSFSFAVQIKAKLADIINKPRVFQFSSFNLYFNARLCFYCPSAFGDGAIATTIEQNNKILDGNWHSIICTYDGITCKLFDEDGLLISASGTIPTATSTNFMIGNNGFVGQMSRIKYFNFDMSADDAPYTIADYIAGKDESPLLKLGNDFNFNLTSESTFTQRTTDSNLTLTDSSTNVGYIKFEAEPITNLAPYFWFPLGKTIKKGARVEVSFDGKAFADYGHLSVGFGNQGKFTITDSISSVASSVIKTITLSEDCDCIVFVGIQDKAIQYDIRLSAFANGALLSLEDIKSGVQVLDKSGNGNHANISGTVYASKENNPARCVDSASFSWAGTATTQKFVNSDVAIPANSKVVAYAKANVGMSASFTCGSNSAVSKELSANTLTEIGSFLNASQGAFKVAPSSAITGKMEVYLTIEKF